MKDIVLVTGGAGFLGSHIAADLLALGKKVIVLDDLSGGDIRNVPHGSVFVKGSVTDVALLDRLFKRHKFSHVFHLAAYAAENLSHFIRRFNYENNLIGSVNLINAAVNYKVKAFAFTSSIAVYGANQLPMTEKMTPSPEDPYGISKLAVEQDLKAAARLFGLNYVIFRPHNVYGERQNLNDKYRNVIGIFMNQLMRARPLTVFGDGCQKRAFTYVRDISPVMAEALFNKKAYGNIFNIGADKPCTVGMLAQKVAKALGNSQPEIRHLAAREEVKFAFSSHVKAKKILGYKPKCSLEQGLANMAAWAKAAKYGEAKKFKNIEIKKNLPEGW